MARKNITIASRAVSIFLLNWSLFEYDKLVQLNWSGSKSGKIYTFWPSNLLSERWEWSSISIPWLWPVYWRLDKSLAPNYLLSFKYSSTYDLVSQCLNMIKTWLIFFYLFFLSISLVTTGSLTMSSL